jgi:hypothetical protein
VVTQLPYSPGSVPYDFSLFRRIKLLPRGFLIEDIPEILKQPLTVLFAIPKASSCGGSCSGNNPGKMA